MIKSRLVALLALAGVLFTSSLAHAQAEAPKTSATSKTLYLTQTGCGTGKGTLLPRPDGQSGNCGDAFGVPISEVFHQVGSDSFDKYVSTDATKPFKINGAKKVTGQLTAESFLLSHGGGVGTVTFEIKLTMETKNDSVTFAPITVSRAVATSGSCYVPFSMHVPKALNGQVVTEIAMSVDQRGANFPMSVFGMSGDSYLVVPAKK